jgi:regulator of protease activity HflC (stomatin/prohibitin superfamily)
METKMMEEDVVLTGNVLAVDGNSSKKRNSNSTTSKLLHLNRSINGQNGGVSFFLPPYCKIVELVWSNGVKKDKRGRKMTIFDSRPWYMNYEFVVRTSDNVELNLSMSFFWSLENIAYMIRNTDDAPGDICHHARSEIIQAVSKVTLKDFMENFNQIIHQTILESNDPFYEARGSKIHSVEVRSFECLDKKIDSVLQEIIKESTDRINRLQLVESENEVALEKMKGRIEEEKIKGQLIDVKNEHQRKEALIDGEAEAERVSAFIKGLNGVCSAEQAIKIFNELRKAEVMTELANSDAHLYFTPAECDLRLGMSTVQDERNGRKSMKNNKMNNQKHDNNKFMRNSTTATRSNNEEESKLSAASLI